MLKGKPKTQTNEGDTAADAGQFRENPKVNARIDDYIKNNPKRWEYIQAMPPERMARALILNEVNKLERQEKIKDGFLHKLEQNPELKQAYQTLVKHLPEDQRENAMLSIAGKSRRAANMRPAQSTGGVGV
jgi:hypothetical protein